MDPVDAFLHEIQGGVSLELGSLEEPQRQPSNVQQPSTYALPRGLMHALRPEYTQASTYPHYPGYGHQDRAHLQSQLSSQTDIPLDAFDKELLSQSQTGRQWQATNRPAQSSILPEPHRLGPSTNMTSWHAQDKSNTHLHSSINSRPQPSSFLSTQSIRTPPRHQGLSSSPFVLHSSPSYGVSQRRNQHNEHLHSGLEVATNRRYLPSSTSSPFEQRPLVRELTLGHAPPTVQGIQLVSLNILPDRVRSIFPFELFNAVQSKCFEAVYRTNDNIVLSAPTGSGKTAVLEMAICRLMEAHQTNQYKIVYQAPTKSLCSERQRDWQAKFAPLDLQCAELTGDSDNAQLRNVQNATIIITTPEKWDSMTRKWKDQSKLMGMVKLFLIDEVHILKDARGATLEAVVSRMKSVGSNVRFVALSASVPNSEDIATWLGKDGSNQNLPAHQERFGEEFRPVKLQKQVHGFQSHSNDFAFDKLCETKLPDIIAKYSKRKPIMVFCCTRRSCVSTAKSLANLWATKDPRDRNWPPPTQRLTVRDNELRNTITSAVAFHHAGLDGQDRQIVEKGFLEGQISVICCTSTLAVGVNLPCHLVIVKNTVTWQDNSWKEYADLEMMQMLGRAGRPQFDNSAIAVILTRQDKVAKYEKMVSGQELLESCLHSNLIDHLNAEIGLGTVTDVNSAKRWLAGTFLYVRLKQNPKHYKLDGDTRSSSLEERLEIICARDIQLLQETELISMEGRLKSTHFGDAMARYYVKFETMKVFLSLQQKAKISEILSVLAQGDEFKDIRLKSGEKALYKEINRANAIRFPIPVDIALAAHKVSLLIQAELGGVDFPANDQFQIHKAQYQIDKGTIFQHIHRLIRCVIDCQIYLQDSVTVRHGLELARSLAARVWDNSPLQLKQINQIGIVAVRKLAAVGINSIEVLDNTEAHRLEMIMSRNPPWGSNILASLKDFPKLRVSVKMMGKDLKAGKPVTVKIKAEIGFLNEKAPSTFHRKPIYVCFLAETSNGNMVDFRRVSAKKLTNGLDILISAELFNEKQYITCYVMCDEIAGTMQYAELRPQLAASLFPSKSKSNPEASEPGASRMNISRRRSRTDSRAETDEFGGDMLDDGDLLAAVDDIEFTDIDYFDSRTPKSRSGTNAGKETMISSRSFELRDANEQEDVLRPKQLENGKWTCNHKCKSKQTCKHMCCREGLDNPPKPSAKLATTKAKPERQPTKQASTVLYDKPSRRLHISPNGQLQIREAAKIETVDLSNGGQRERHSGVGQQKSKSLDRRHSSIQKTAPVKLMSQKRSTFSREYGTEPTLSFLNKPEQTSQGVQDALSDYDDSWMDDLPSPSALTQKNTLAADPLPSRASGENRDAIGDGSLSDLEACMVGLEDSMLLGNGESDGAIDTLPYTMKNFGGQQRPAQGSKSTCSSSPKHAPLIFSRPEKRYQARRKSQGIFLSTDSPQKPECSPLEINTQRRNTNSAMGSDEIHQEDVSTRKRRRLENGQDLQTVANSNERTSVGEGVPEERGVKPGWEGIDPEFVAEYGDIVELVDSLQ